MHIIPGSIYGYIISPGVSGCVSQLAGLAHITQAYSNGLLLQRWIKKNDAIINKTHGSSRWLHIPQHRPIQQEDPSQPPAFSPAHTSSLLRPTDSHRRLPLTIRLYWDGPQWRRTILVKFPALQQRELPHPSSGRHLTPLLQRVLAAARHAGRCSPVAQMVTA